MLTLLHYTVVTMCVIYGLLLTIQLFILLLGKQEDMRKFFQAITLLLFIAGWVANILYVFNMFIMFIKIDAFSFPSFVIVCFISLFFGYSLFENLWRNWRTVVETVDVELAEVVTNA